MEKKRYGSIDGLRTIAAFGIVMMHMRANNQYEIAGVLYNKVISSLTDFVFLFMMISAFGMCCGYYEKILQSKISIADFYSKRFKKVLPFFSVLVLLDIIISPSVNSVYEAFADLTLLFGLLPDAGNLTVIGVGWFLGLIFVFYLIFPFYCVLLANKRRAWCAFGISLIYHFVCSAYFDVGRQNILYCGCYFLAGGLLYLYEDNIAEWSRSVRWSRWIVFAFGAASVCGYYCSSNMSIWCLPISAVMLIYAIAHSGGALDNRFTKFFSGISMEIYLTHMMIFRIGEKLHLNTLLGNGWVQYLFTVLWVIVGATVFAVILRTLIRAAERKLSEKVTSAY